MTSLPQISLDSSGRPFCLSTDISSHFQKKHQHVLRDIDRLISLLPTDFTASNFGPSEYTDSTGRKLRQYKLSRDAFTLLVMGFTGNAALAWKLRYIEAFNQLEKIALEKRESLALKAAYQKGLQEGKKRDGLLALEKLISYVRRGLTKNEIGKIFGVSSRTVRRRIKAAKAKGLWPLMESQLSLPGVAR